jgi:hypothetical protein
MEVIVFDIETGPLPLDTIKQILPAWDPDSVGPHPGSFDESNVKLGRLVDADKIAEKKREALEKYNKSLADYFTKKDNGEANYWKDIQEKAALSAVTGQVVAIGYHGRKRMIQAAIDGVNERSLLTYFWKTYLDARQTNRSMVGFNSKAFDIPFIVQRSWIIGVEVPKSILTPTGYLDSTFIDLMERWKCGNRSFGQPGHTTLDAVCRACGLPGKPDDCTGADVARLLWSDKPEDREKALSYIDGDIESTLQLAQRLGVAS